MNDTELRKLFLDWWDNEIQPTKEVVMEPNDMEFRVFQGGFNLGRLAEVRRISGEVDNLFGDQ